MNDRKRMEITIDQHKNAVLSFEEFLLYLKNQIFIYELANDNFTFDREIELLKEIENAAVNYSKIYKK